MNRNGDANVVGISVGSIVLYAGRDIPRGWMLCDGTAVSRDLYRDLFETIGAEAGSGDGEATFNLPTLISPAPNLRYIIYAGG